MTMLKQYLFRYAAFHQAMEMTDESDIRVVLVHILCSAGWITPARTSSLYTHMDRQTNCLM